MHPEHPIAHVVLQKKCQLSDRCRFMCVKLVCLEVLETKLRIFALAIAQLSGR